MNPFTPRPGETPRVLAGRDGVLDAVSAALAGDDGPRTCVITGLRGVGKSVLLRAVTDRATTQGWATVVVRPDPDGDLCRAVAVAVLPVLARLRPATYLPIAEYLATVTAMTGPDAPLMAAALDLTPGQAPLTGQAGLVDLVSMAAMTAKAARQGVLIVVDDLHDIPRSSIEVLLQSVSVMAGIQAPIAMIGAGLPPGPVEAPAQWWRELPLGPLDPSGVDQVLRDGFTRQNVTIGRTVAHDAWRITGGHPHCLQILGHTLWEARYATPDKPLARITSALLTQIQPTYRARIAGEVLAPVLAPATTFQRQYLTAMAALGDGPWPAGTVAAQLGRDASQVAMVRRRLIDHGILYPPQRGLAAPTVPALLDYLRPPDQP